MIQKRQKQASADSTGSNLPELQSTAAAALSATPLIVCAAVGAIVVACVILVQIPSHTLLGELVPRQEAGQRYTVNTSSGPKQQQPGSGVRAITPFGRPKFGTTGGESCDRARAAVSSMTEIEQV